jgi:hypothetical protein
MQLIKEKYGHWYQVLDGKCVPKHEWPKKDKSGMKRTTLREAKEFHLFPSVTNVIDGVIAKPELTRWLISQGIMAALTLPRKDGEPEDQFAMRVAEDMDAYSAEARDFGTECHDHIDHYITHGEILMNDAEPFTKGARQWIMDNVVRIHGTELTVFHPELCIAGRLDLDCELRREGRAIVDFKSQRVKNNKPVFYDEFGLQLAAYASCVRHQQQQQRNGAYEPNGTFLPKLVSVIIGSEEPGPAFTKIYEDGEYLLRLFKNTLDLWCYKKGYDPRINK